MLKHNYIGTEHLLLGLLREEDGVAAHVLESFEITADGVRVQVAEIVGEGDEAVTGQIPFTPRAKKVLELSLREALHLGHNYIGTEHILLGLAREDARRRGADPARLRRRRREDPRRGDRSARDRRRRTGASVERPALPSAAHSVGTIHSTLGVPRRATRPGRPSVLERPRRRRLGARQRSPRGGLARVDLQAPPDAARRASRRGLVGCANALDHVEEHEHEERDADHAVHREERRVETVEVSRPDERVLVGEHRCDDDHAEPVPDADREAEAGDEEQRDRRDVQRARGREHRVSPQRIAHECRPCARSTSTSKSE